MFPLTPLDWSVAALQMGTQIMGAQMRVAQVLFEAGLQQQKAMWGLRTPLPMPTRMSAPVTMGICGPMALAGAGTRPLPRPRAGRVALLKAVPSTDSSSKARRRRGATVPPEMPPAPASDGDDKTPV
ncbi:hypothetical protein [Salipiger thiooxidans]|uniref:hypothetical protein n=1 Tax=Salipiger thiooxidans TaxID=282683 RepID=UPI001CD6279B|nr:hypothetical protein [Salipiger thiooxidans]MCA0845833.1 hypothetical protein [Salipiger thiooxidans]